MTDSACEISAPRAAAYTTGANIPCDGGIAEV
jgi:hypothetical protein